MASEALPVLIVGAGPTGLVLALWLNRLGVRLRVIDRAPGTGTASRALAVQARTLEFYSAFGLHEAILAAGVPARAVNLWVRGRRRARVPFGRVGEGLSPFPNVLILPQDVHEQILLHRLKAEGISIDWESELVDFRVGDSDVTARVRSWNGAVETYLASYLCGCDGASSLVRRGLGVEFLGGTYSQLFYVADVEAEGEAVDGELHVSLEAADFCAVFPMKGTNCARLVGLVDDPRADPESLAYEEVRGRAEQALGLSVRRVNWFSTYKVHHRVAEGFRRGRVFLLGDAAHIHSPAGGQGMNTGIGDAVNLAWKLAMVLGGRGDDNLLDSYEAERIAFARRLVRTTDQAFRAVVNPSRLGQLIRTRVVPAILPFLARQRVVRQFAFRTVSQTALSYRGSPLAEGRAGAIRGGDRLPWLPLGGSSNFVPLRSLDWQVHVYGVVRPGLEGWCEKEGVPVHSFAFGPEAKVAGFCQDAAYLVRPDGHVACAVPDQDPALFEKFLFTHRLSPGKPQRH